jgi:uncharacterized protein
MKTIVIHHSADYDGIFCREIARKFIPDAELIGWDFADKPLEIPTATKIYVMDLPLDRVFGFEYKPGDQDKNPPKHPAGLVWIDHHNSSILTHPRSIPGYRIDGVAACRLAWAYLATGGVGLPLKEDFINRKVLEPLAVRLAGEYDIWDKRDPNAELFQHGLRSRDITPEIWNHLLGDGRNPKDDEVVLDILNSGECIQYFQRKQDSFVAKNRSFDVQWEGLKFMAINAVRCNSLTFESATRSDHDGLMGFFWNGKEWTVSLYHAPHRKDLDLSAIAVKYGGGGHRGACGFRINKLPFIP